MSTMDIITLKFVAVFLICLSLLLATYFSLVGWHGTSWVMLLLIVVSAAYYVFLTLVLLNFIICYGG
jgi:hypothetical protein